MTARTQADYDNFRLTVVVTDPPWYENCYIVQNRSSGEQIVVDPGSNAERILTVLTAQGGPVREILLTHGHPDHVGAVRALQQALNLPCRAHRREAPLLADISTYARRRLGLEIEPPLSVTSFDDDVELSLGGRPIRLIVTPGHTPGGVCYDFGGFALTGDTLFNHGIGRTDLPGGDAALLARSLTHLLAELPDDTDLYSGHGPAWTVAEARPWWSGVSDW